MIHISRDFSKVVLPWREDLAAIIPHGREFDFQGQRLFMMPNGQTEARIARNLGIPVPAPILTRYDWRRSKPWDIQRVTSAFLTECERAYVLNTMGCVDADTEYLAPDGWHRIADYKAGPVAEYRPDTGSIGFVQPSEYVKLPCHEMIRFKTTRGVDQLLSPEHRVLYVTCGGICHVASAESIMGEYPTMNANKVNFITTFTVDGGTECNLSDAELRIHVALSADGYNPYNDRVDVRIKKPRKQKRLRELLVKANIDYKERDVEPEGFKTFTFRWPYSKGFVGAFDLPQRQLEIIADEAPYWDGSHRKANGVEFSSYDPHSADLIQYALSATGRRASRATSSRVRRGRLEEEHRVHASAGKPTAGLVGLNPDGTRRRNVWRERTVDGFKYCFMVPSTFLLLRRNGCIFATGNTGKTRCVLYAYDFLQKSGILTGPMLITAPLSTLTPVWEREVFNVMGDRKVKVLYGDRQKRIRLLKERADIYVINHHGMGVILEEIIAKGFSIFVVDELATFRNKSTDLWRAASAIEKSLSAGMNFMWGLTGSPTPQSPTDAWAQCRLLTPATVPRTMAQFADLTMRRVSQFRYVARPDANETVHKAMQPSVRYTIQDVMELPPTIYIDKIVKLDPQAKLAYDRLWKKAKIVTDAGKNITAVNEGVLHNKLMQVAAGYIYADDKTIYELPHQNRLDALLETVEEADGKVIVFVTYKHALAGIAKFLRDNKRTVGEISGDTPRHRRDAIFRGFQDGPIINTIVAHPQCMSHGLTLTAADTIIWYCPTQSLETYDQGNHRIIRPSQTRKTRVVHLFGTTVERVTYNRLKNRATMQGCLLEMFHSQELVF